MKQDVLVKTFRYSFQHSTRYFFFFLSYLTNIFLEFRTESKRREGECLFVLISMRFMFNRIADLSKTNFDDSERRNDRKSNKIYHLISNLLSVSLPPLFQMISNEESFEYIDDQVESV